MTMLWWARLPMLQRLRHDNRPASLYPNVSSYFSLCAFILLPNDTSKTATPTTTVLIPDTHDYRPTLVLYYVSFHYLILFHGDTDIAVSLLFFMCILDWAAACIALSRTDALARCFGRVHDACSILGSYFFFILLAQFVLPSFCFFVFSSSQTAVLPFLKHQRTEL